MSKLKKVIKRTEEWLKNQKICWATNDSNGLASDIQRLIDTARAATIAVERLQKAQRYEPADPTSQPSRFSCLMERCEQGGWIEADDVDRVIKILQNSNS
jgi:hypothetical protein